MTITELKEKNITELSRIARTLEIPGATTDPWVMSPPMVGISTTYRTRVALEVIVRNGKESLLDR